VTPLVITHSDEVRQWATARIEELLARLPAAVAADRRQRVVWVVLAPNELGMGFHVPPPRVLPAHCLVVRLAAPLDDPMNIETLAHELAHSALGHLSRTDLAYTTTEAEVAAFLPTLRPPVPIVTVSIA
jgi:sirohydrochlorin ferrochelatase